jgi:peptidyl-tRNA hydrolase
MQKAEGFFTAKRSLYQLNKKLVFWVLSHSTFMNLDGMRVYPIFKSLH